MTLLKSSPLHQTLAKAKLNPPAKTSHINSIVKEAGCNFNCFCIEDNTH